MRTLQNGMRGPDVRGWQSFLSEHGFAPGPLDSIFGPRTEAATKAFQEREGLLVDGIVGKKTFARATALGLRTLRRLTNEEVTPAITAAAKRILSEHRGDAYGTEIAFEADGLEYVGRIEEHYHPPGGPLKPWGYHPGVSVFAVVGGTFDVDDPTDGSGEVGGVGNVDTPAVPKFTLSERSREQLKGVHPDLVTVVERAMAITPRDFMVLEGVRSLERQRQMVAQGRSRTLNSRHLTGHAVDLAPVENGSPVWDWPAYDLLAETVKEAARDVGVPIEWGGDWTSFRDGPHWQLPRGYV